MTHDSGQAGVLVISISSLRAVLVEDLSVLLSQFEYGRGPAEYEVDYIIGGIVQRGKLRSAALFDGR